MSNSQALKFADQRQWVLEHRSHLPFLNLRTQELMEFRYGLDSGHSHTLRQTADRFGISPQRVRAILRDGERQLAGGQAQPAAEPDDGSLTEYSDILELGLETRAYNLLRRRGIRTVAQLLALTEQQLESLYGCGPQTAVRIRGALAAHGWALRVDAITHEARIVYTNWRGETAERRIVPSHIWYGSTRWHTEPQWLLHARDPEKGDDRDFALADIQRWL